MEDQVIWWAVASILMLYYLIMRGGYGGPGDLVSFSLYPEAVLPVYERWVWRTMWFGALVSSLRPPSLGGTSPSLRTQALTFESTKFISNLFIFLSFQNTEICKTILICSTVEIKKKNHQCMVRNYLINFFYWFAMWPLILQHFHINIYMSINKSKNVLFMNKWAYSTMLSTKSCYIYKSIYVYNPLNLLRNAFNQQYILLAQSLFKRPNIPRLPA